MGALYINAVFLKCLQRPRKSLKLHTQSGRDGRLAIGELKAGRIEVIKDTEPQQKTGYALRCRERYKMFGIYGGHMRVLGHRRQQVESKTMVFSGGLFETENGKFQKSRVFGGHGTPLLT